jgi:hypothetical protein
MAQSRPQKDSFIVYRSFYDAIKPLSDQDQLLLLKQIFEFGLNQKEIDLEPLPKAMFALIKPQLEANHKRYENGTKGGRPKTKEKPKDNQKITKEKPNKNKNVNVNVNKNVNKEKEKALDIQLFVDEGFDKKTLQEIIEHRKVVVKKPILTNRMMKGLLNALTEYYQHWEITPEDAVDYYLSKTWASIDKEYKYPHRKMKQSKVTDDLTYSDIGKILKQRKTVPQMENDSKIIKLTRKVGV